MAPQLQHYYRRYHRSWAWACGIIQIAVLLLGGGEALSLDYYDERCPQAEAAVTTAVKQAMAKDQTVPAALLRMHFHDCFVRVRTCP